MGTAEFLDIYQLMFYGPKMFYLNDENEVEFKLAPALPSWLFVNDEGIGGALTDDDGQYIVSFKLFGVILVTYHNPDGANIYGVAPKRYTITMKDGTVEAIDGEFVPTDLAKKIRRTTDVANIDAFF